MKIGNNPERAISGTGGPVPSDTSSSVRASKGAASAEGGVEAGVKVSLSSSADQLLVGSSRPEFDQAKVDRIKQAIDDGSYEVNAEAIADKLIANASELLGKR